MIARFLSLARVFGLMLMVFSVTYLLPVLTSLIYSDGTARLFLEDMLFALGAGAALWYCTRRFHRDLKAKEGFLLVVLTWTGCPGHQPVAA